MNKKSLKDSDLVVNYFLNMKNFLIININTCNPVICQFLSILAGMFYKFTLPSRF